MTWSRSALALAVLATLPASAALAADPPLGPASVPPGHYALDPQHASLTATVRHQGVSNYVLRFDTLDASFDYDPAHPEATHLTASVDPASLDVNGNWAKQFADEFLHAGQFPTATFTSTSVQALGGPQGTVSGDLTLMGVTKPVTFTVTLIGSAKEPFPPLVGPRAVGIEAVTTIKRSEFGSNYVLSMVGDDVTLTFEGEFDKK
jgi:polyisoprenoid-binding protein YceI